MCGYSKSNCKIAFFKFSATFQILCTISNLLLGFEFCAASLVWWQMGRMNIMKNVEGDWRRSRRRKKVNHEFSTLGPLVLKTLNYQTQPHCTDPEHRLQLQHFLCVLNYQHHHLLKWIVTKKKHFLFQLLFFTSSGTGILGLFRISTAERSFFTENDSCEKML